MLISACSGGIGATVYFCLFIFESLALKRQPSEVLLDEEKNDQRQGEHASVDDASNDALHFRLSSDNVGLGNSLRHRTITRMNPKS